MNKPTYRQIYKEIEKINPEFGDKILMSDGKTHLFLNHYKSLEQFSLMMPDSTIYYIGKENLDLASVWPVEVEHDGLRIGITYPDLKIEAEESRKSVINEARDQILAMIPVDWSEKRKEDVEKLVKKATRTLKREEEPAVETETQVITDSPTVAELIGREGGK